jgi:tripeptide aminopeptidase
MKNGIATRMVRYTACGVQRSARHVGANSTKKEAPAISAITPTIDALLTQPDIERLLSRANVSLADTIALTASIAQIPAPTGAEAARAAFVAREMRAIGLADVRTDDVGNAIGRRPGNGNGPAVMIAAHTDTVFPAETDLTVRRTTERIAGPGVGDNSLGVAAMLTAARLLTTLDLTTAGDILFVADVGEEGLGDLRGMRAAVSAYRERLGAVVAVEGHNLGRVTHRAVGSRRYRLTVQGPGGHSWGNYGRPNAIHILAKLITDLVALPIPSTPKTSLSVGTIEGGVSVNTIAPAASALVDLRSISQANLERLAAQVERAVRSVHIADVQVTASILGDRPAGDLPADAPIVRACMETLRALGIAPTLDASSTDANVPIGLGIPAVCIGIAEGGNAHRLEEFIRISTIPTGLQQLLLLILALGGYDAG